MKDNKMTVIQEMGIQYFTDLTIDELENGGYVLQIK